ncbi:hypothetical protein CPB86DRAFT_777828 [Serendipita vermifera]|nr:hypothetical protein CPB86DRAFT_777828 [Serendipita vermifera]
MGDSYTPSLPIEVWQDISSFLDKRTDRLALVCVCKAFQGTFTSALYSDIMIKGPERLRDPNEPTLDHGPDSPFALAGHVACSLLERLDTNPELRSYVRRCEIRSLKPATYNYLVSDEEMSLISAIFTLVGDLPFLQDVCLHSMVLPASWLLYICSRPHLALNVTTIATTLHGQPELQQDMVFTAKSLVLETSQFRLSSPAITAMVLGGSLRELVLSTQARAPMSTLFDAHASRGSPQLPKLEVLEIGWLSAEYFDFFKSTPNLLELRLKGLGRMDLGDRPLEPTLLPKLERFTSHNLFLNLFIPGRPIKSIVTRDSTGFSHPFHLGQEDNPPFNHYQPNFGSTSVLESLTWNNCTRNREVFRYIADHCRRIVYLNVTPALGYEKQELYERLQVLKVLTELRTLYVRTLSHVPYRVSLNWEEEFCKELRADGSPYLCSVSFSELIEWNRKWDSEVWVPSGEGLPLYESGWEPMVIPIKYSQLDPGLGASGPV